MNIINESYNILKFSLNFFNITFNKVCTYLVWTQLFFLWDDQLLCWGDIGKNSTRVKEYDTQNQY